MNDIKRVYLVELVCNLTINGDPVKVGNTIGIYEDIDDAIDAMMINDDSELTIADAKKMLQRCGTAESTWGATKIGSHIATKVHVTTTEHVLVKSSKGS